MLDRKVLRDLWHLRAQATAIVLVIACGVGLFLGMRSTMRSLAAAQASYHASTRFAHVFATVERAPENVADRLAALPGVQRVETRVVAFVTLDVPGMVEAATGQLVSIPDRGRPRLNDLHLRSGRLPTPGRVDEVVASEAFAEAHGLPLGIRLGAIINGRFETLRVVGTALSPEFTYALGPGQLFPDDRRFGVLWMRRSALAAAHDMEGAFNDVSLQVDRDASVDEVLRRVDGVLETHGGIGAIPRADQTSYFFMTNEFKQLDTFAFMLPVIFLAVSAFLLNVVIGRTVASQREEIATLKALGYRDREVGLHFAKLVGLIIGGGLVAGLLLGTWMGSGLLRMYADYYRFPELTYRLGPGELLVGAGVTIAAAALGAAGAVRRTVRLPPAEAMRPEAPPDYRPTLLERFGLADLVPTSTRVVLRELERKPARAGMTVVGVALATALVVVNTFFFDSILHLVTVHFGLSQRDDVTLQLVEARDLAALTELEHLPGVLHAEPIRAVPVRLRAGRRHRDVGLTGLPADAGLQVLLGEDLGPVALPTDGLVLSRRLASILGVSRGDVVQVEVREGSRTVHDVPVARIVDTFIGLTAHLELGALARLLREAPSFNAASLLVDERFLDELHGRVKELPVVAGITTRHEALRSFNETIDQNLGRSIAIGLAFAIVVALGVLYNAARLTLSERARELASLRVLGFRRREVGAMLLGELAVLTAVGVPLGLWMGCGLAWLLVSSPGFNTDQFRLPYVVSGATLAIAALTVMAASALSGWAAWRRLQRIDIIEVLKSRD